MYLDSIKIRNYFSIDAVGIELNNLKEKKEIYFAGENGVGKTILLQAITIAIKGTQQIDAVIDVLKQNKKEAKFQSFGVENIDFYAYGINRLFIRSLEEIDFRNEEVYISLFDNSRSLTNPVYWLQMLELDKRHQKDSIKPEEVTMLLSELLDKEIDIKIENKGVSFIERNADLQFTQLSDGYKSAIAWIVDLLARLSFNQPKIRQLEDYKAVVCVDEIGIYLHRKLKFDLVKKLRSKFTNIQWIFTTHSPIVMLGASEDAVAFKLYKKDVATRVSEPIDLKNLSVNSLISSNLLNLDFFDGVANDSICLQREKNFAQKALASSEKNFRNIFDNSKDAIYITNGNGKILAVNQSAIKNAGFLKEDTIGKNLQEFVFEEFERDLSNHFSSISKDGLSIVEAEYTNRENKTRDIELSGCKIEYAGKTAFLNIAHDVTERHQMAMQTMRTIIETEERERNRFAKDLHDGLGALLSGVNMYLNLLYNKKVKPEQYDEILRHTKKLIHEAVQNTRDIARNIKPYELSKFGLGFSIKSFCSKVITLDMADVEVNTENFDIKLDDEIELVIFRIITELINNTIKHSEATKINIFLSVDDSILRLIYTDNGVGFDVESAKTQDNSGMGINNILSRAKTIKGKAKLHSVKGFGMEYNLKLKLKNVTKIQIAEKK